MWNPFKTRKNVTSDAAPPVPLASDAPNYLLVTYDSCRFDAYQAAKTPVLDAHVVARRAFAQATYTFASHASMFQGMLPHVFEEEEFYNRFVKQMWRVQHRKRANARLNMPPGALSVIDGFNKLGYFTCGTGAMGWFKNNHQLLEFWQEFEYTGIAARKQVAWTTRQLQLHRDRPFFAFINFGETHAPYRFDGAPGLEGDAVARGRHEGGKKRDGHDEAAEFDAAMWQMQVDCVEFLDARMGELLAFFDRTGQNVTVVMCGDHGDCFGEEGLYGHGFYHPKVMEVPMAVFDYVAESEK